MDAIRITNSEGRDFLVRPVFTGEFCHYSTTLTHDHAEPIFEFYDATAIRKDQPLGQYVSAYFASTLVAMAPGVGIALEGSVPVWTVDGAALSEIRDLARAITTA